MFRIKDGHVDYRSRYVRTQRWKAQHAARKSLFGMYRNPGTDDPSVKGLSRGTANTQIFYHHKTLLAMKEDSPPVALDPLTLDTVDDYYNFGGGMQGQTFTAHPKLDPVSGELVCFGYEAKGFLTRDIEIFTVAPDGKVNWRTFAKAPYAGMIHDFAVTQKHVAFLIAPLASNAEIIKQGGPHFAWDSKLPSYVGVMPRSGDGKDMRWYKGPAWMATHTMGAWSDGDKVYIDMDGADGNQFPFFPSLHEPFNPQNLQGNIVRLTVDFSKKSGGYEKKILFPDVTGVLSRQDDRYHTIPYRYGFINAFGSESAWVMVDHQTGKVSRYAPGPDAQLNEACFVPRKKSAGEGDGYLIGVVNRLKENGRSDLLLVDTKNLEAGPVAIVKMPYRVVGQVHGFWVAGDDLPAAA
jgi:carotenoid cleavage dioxygenase